MVIVSLVQSWVPLMTQRCLTPASWTPTGVRAAMEPRARTSSKTPAHPGSLSTSVFYLPLVGGKKKTTLQERTLNLAITHARCCNTCDDVREAYRRRGWAFKNADTIEQCKREGFTQKMQEQKNEGCQVYGFLEVNKVGTSSGFYYHV